MTEVTIRPFPFHASDEALADLRRRIAATNWPELELLTDAWRAARPATRRTYAAPARLQLNHWALSGDWTVREQAAMLNTAKGWITHRFHACDLHLVLAPAAGGSPVRFRVLLDGQWPGDAHGVDVDDQGNGVVTEPRLY
jgi:predicted ATPase